MYFARASIRCCLNAIRWILRSYNPRKDTRDGTPGAGFDLGGYINLSENDHILIALGRSFRGENVVAGYLGFQYTI